MGAEGGAELRMRQRVVDGGLQIAELAAAVITGAHETVCVHRLLVEQSGDAVGELDLAARAASDALEVIEDARREQVAPHHRQRRGCSGRPRLLDDAVDAPRVAAALRGDDAVFAGLGTGHDLATDHARLPGRVDIGHLRQHRLLGVDEIVGEMHEERLVAHRRPRAEHRVAETERRRLADVDAGGIARQHAAQLTQQVRLALLLEQLLELLVGVEVVLDGALGGAGDEHQPARARGEGFLDRVLDQRLVDDRQHLLRARLGGRQEARAAPRDRENRRLDG